MHHLGSLEYRDSAQGFIHQTSGLGFITHLTASTRTASRVLGFGLEV